MEKIIDRKVYNTKKAELIMDYSEPNYWDKNFTDQYKIYRTQKNQYFLWYFYQNKCEDVPKEDIKKLSKDETIEYLITWNAITQLNQRFPDVLENA